MKRIIALALIALCSVFAISEGALDDWAARYNQAAAETGAGSIRAASAEDGGNGTYRFLLDIGAYLSIRLPEGGSADALSLETDAVSDSLFLALAAALAASDESVSAQAALAICAQIQKNFAAAGSAAYTAFEAGEWAFIMAGMEIGQSRYFVITAMRGVNAAHGGGAPDAGDGGFWDGLWGDDEVTPSEAAPKSERIIHKI